MSSQVYIIASEDIRNEVPDNLSVSKMQEIIDSILIKTLDKPTTLYFETERECIDLASYLYEKSTENYNVHRFIGLGVLFNRRILLNSEKIEDVPDMPDHPFIKLHNPSARCLSHTNDKKEIIETILAQYEGVIENILIISKMDLFNVLKSELSLVRNFDPLHFGIIDVASLRHDNSVASGHPHGGMPVEDTSGTINLTEKDICNQIEELLKSQLLTSKLSQHLDYSESQITSLSNMTNYLKASENKLLSLLANSSGSSISYHDVIKIEGLVKALKSKIESLSSLIKQAENMCETLANPNLEQRAEGFLKVRKFHFDKTIGKFKMQIENETQFDFYNITAYILDDTGPGFRSTELCVIRIIEKGQKIWKELDDEYTEKFYGLHLTLVYRGQHILAEPYFISPCKLSYKIVTAGVRNVEIQGLEPEDVNYKKYAFYLKNYSSIEFGKFELSLPENIKSEEFGGGEKFNYGVTWVACCDIDDVLKDDKKTIANQYRVFACTGNSIISNTITISGIESDNDGVTFG